MSEEELAKQKKAIHVIGKLSSILFPIGLFGTIGFAILAISFNLIASFAFPLGSVPSSIFFVLSSSCYGLLSTLVLILLASIILRSILQKKKANHPEFQNSVDDFHIY